MQAAMERTGNACQPGFAGMSLGAVDQRTLDCSRAGQLGVMNGHGTFMSARGGIGQFARVSLQQTDYGLACLVRIVSATGVRRMRYAGWGPKSASRTRPTGKGGDGGGCDCGNLMHVVVAIPPGQGQVGRVVRVRTSRWGVPVRQRTQLQQTHVFPGPGQRRMQCKYQPQASRPLRPTADSPIHPLVEPPREPLHEPDPPLQPPTGLRAQ
jgi:hypothetical protein